MFLFFLESTENEEKLVLGLKQTKRGFPNKNSKGASTTLYEKYTRASASIPNDNDDDLETDFDSISGTQLSASTLV